MKHNIKSQFLSNNINKTQFLEQNIFHASFISCILSNKNKVLNLTYIVEMQST